VPAVRLHVPLPAGVGIDVEHGDPDPAQFADQPLLLEAAGLEQAQHAPALGSARDPAELVPERPITVPIARVWTDDSLARLSKLTILG
jgi:hypothetical protein